VPTTMTWTFVLTGEVRSGVGAVLTAINNRTRAVCHADLFHPASAVRAAAHLDYFGTATSPFAPGEVSPHHYLSAVALVPQRDETTVGVYVPHRLVREYDLYDLLEEQTREGGFSVVQVVRNPVACFVSWKQAQQSGVWTRGWDDRGPLYPPTPVRLDPAELTGFCRTHAATAAKIRAAVSDRLDVTYRELVLHYQDTMRKVFDHVELPDEPILARPACRRLRNRPVPDRATNWAETRLAVPADVRALMDADDLF